MLGAAPRITAEVDTVPEAALTAEQQRASVSRVTPSPSVTVDMNSLIGPSLPPGNREG